jgi:tetratricopeptide (TPR) repeat protein
MVQRSNRPPHILNCYKLYLEDGDSARFVRDVALRYSVSTLVRVTGSSDAAVRRAAVLSLGILGDRKSITCLGKLLADSDRPVRLIADDAVKAIWARTTSSAGKTLLDAIAIHLSEEEYDEAVQTANELIHIQPSLPEAYCQRALAHYACGSTELAIRDCERAIELNEFEYMALVGLGQCYLEIEQPRTALDYFRQAISIYPDLEPVHLQIRKLEESLREII